MNRRLRKKRILKLRRAGKKLRSLANRKIRKTLNPNERDEISKYNDWLLDSSKVLNRLADQLGKAKEGKIEEINEAILEKRQELLQQAQQMMKEMMQTLSDIMKKSHDNAKAIINNLR